MRQECRWGNGDSEHDSFRFSLKIGGKWEIYWRKIWWQGEFFLACVLSKLEILVYFKCRRQWSYRKEGLITCEEKDNCRSDVLRNLDGGRIRDTLFIIAVESRECGKRWWVYGMEEYGVKMGGKGRQMIVRLIWNKWRKCELFFSRRKSKHTRV